MSYTLRTGEMLQALRNAEMVHEAQQYQAALEAIGTLMADALSRAFDVNYTNATYDLAMVAATFSPRVPAQPLPEALKGFDSEEEWSYD